MSAKTLRCPVCSSDKLSPETTYQCLQDSARFERMGKKSTFKTKDLFVGPERARFCLDCCHMLLFAGAKDVELLRQALNDA